MVMKPCDFREGDIVVGIWSGQVRRSAFERKLSCTAPLTPVLQRGTAPLLSMWDTSLAIIWVRLSASDKYMSTVARSADKG